jgi:ferrochelatase
MERKTCAILLSMGGPDSTEDIREYLYNIFSDRTLIRLPGGSLLQKPFAAMISRLRRKKVQSHYNLIGGGSPLLRWTRAQARHLEQELAAELPGFKAYPGMRYFRPTVDQAIESACRDGFRHIILLPLYPQYSLATTGSSFEIARKSMAKHVDITVTYVHDFHDQRDYVALMQEYIGRNIDPEDTLLFSAHSLPQKFVDDGDPYVEQVKRTAALAAGEREYFVSFQSRTGPVTWVGPDTIVEARRLLAAKPGTLFVVPISFVCDHIETLYEIDIELKELLGQNLGPRIRRMPMFNDDRRFAVALANIIREAETFDGSL